MAQNAIDIDATPERVFEVLSDARNYGHWVVGSKQIRDADEGFPAVGTRFHHTVGWGPFSVDDHTEVLANVPNRLLELRARARPLGTARVRIEVAPHGGGSRVVMVEDPADPLTAWVFNPLTHLLVRGRNDESLRRLKSQAEGRGPSPEQSGAP